MLRVLCFAMLCFYLFCVASLCSALLCFAQLCSLCSVLLFPFCPSCWPGERKPRIQLCVFCRQCLIVRWWTTNPVWKKKHIAEFLASPPPKNSANPGLNSANVRLEFSQHWLHSGTLAELSETLAESSESLAELAGTLAELTATLSDFFSLSDFFFIVLSTVLNCVWLSVLI